MLVPQSKRVWHEWNFSLTKTFMQMIQQPSLVPKLTFQLQMVAHLTRPIADRDPRNMLFVLEPDKLGNAQVDGLQVALRREDFGEFRPPGLTKKVLATATVIRG